MYNSPETKLVKDVFNDEKNFENFFWHLSNNVKHIVPSRKYAEEVYKILRNEVRGVVKNFNKKHKFSLDNQQIRDFFEDAMQKSMDRFIAILKIENQQ
jgi:MinD-like ATPase involved in chromosome partitioning or flagellar assembly